MDGLTFQVAGYLKNLLICSKDVFLPLLCDSEGKRQLPYYIVIQMAS